MTFPPAILLDLDDTIVSLDAGADDGWRAACERHESELPGIGATLLFDALARSRAWFWSDPDRHRVGRLDVRMARRRIVARALDDLGLAREDVAIRLADGYSDERERTVRPLSGALEAVAALRRHGVDLALVTNGEARGQRSKIDRLDLARHFKCILIEGELGYGKPDPRVFERALTTLGRRPEDAWMIGDSLVYDIAPAKQLGIHAIWIDPTQKGLPEDATSRPDRIIRSLADLTGG